MRKSRTLSLKREALTQLSTEEMTSVNGGTHLCGITDGCTHGPSLDATCPTVPPTQCNVVITIKTYCEIDSRLVCS